ncbi:MAG: 30S ribosomal protein S12 methylthiotransferase RimO, partial [Candidatus Kryptonium sp.]
HDIITEKNEKMIGKKLKVLIDRKEKNYYIGRTQWDAPEIDLEVLVEGRSLKVGEFYQVEIYDFFEYDLIGRVAKS